MKLPRHSIDRLLRDFSRAPLGDSRRVQRLERIADKLARRPSASLPAALGTVADLEGAYRFMRNRHVSFEETLEGHVQATRRRVEQDAGGGVLVLHDTTDCSFPSLDPKEIGYLQTGKAGFRLHLSLVVDAAAWRRPLGVVYAETIHRAKRSRQSGKGKASGSKTADTPDREFGRWWRGMKTAGEALASCPQVIHIADREGDSYDLMAALLGAKQRFIIRVRVPGRRGRDIATAKEAGWSTVHQVAAACEGMLERDVPLSRRKASSAPQARRVHPPRKMRMARLRFAATSIEIPRPQYLRDPVPATLRLNLVHVFEPAPPEGEPPVEWLLYTTEPIDTPAAVADAVDNYRTRWTIEEFNAALKTGCSYEKREFVSRHALLNMLAVTLPIACEILWLRSRCRSHPDAPASEVLTPQQLTILRKMGQRKLPAAATAGDALYAVAALGGHQPNNGPPGWKVLARGMELLLAYEAGWEAHERATRKQSGQAARRPKKK